MYGHMYMRTLMSLSCFWYIILVNTCRMKDIEFNETGIIIIIALSGAMCVC